MEREVILAVDIGGSKYVAGLVAADGRVICKENTSGAGCRRSR